ncbi:MAG TPA: hypothetical protein VKE73_04280, partial [Myxococcota bacterium]|nr:hypothetical protein [Myxococcota bacterium]
HTLGSLPLAIVATCREDEATRSPERARALERVLRLTTLERWPLSGLHGAELREFVRLRTGSEPPPSLVAALEHKTGGNPLFLGESLRSLASRGLLSGARDSAAWEALLPQGIQHLVRHKVRPLSAQAREVLALACAAGIGAELDREILVHCHGGGAGLEQALREVEEAGLLSSNGPAAPRVRFPHILVREALYAELVPPGPGRRRIHARITDALESAGITSEEAISERARHACEAVPLIDPHRASELAQAAGARAARLHDFEGAAVWCERALAALGPGSTARPEVRVELLLGLASASARARGLEGARGIYRNAAELARSIRRGDLFSQAALGYASRPSAAGHGDAAVVRLLEEALDLDQDRPQALRVRVLSRLASELRYAEPARAKELVERSATAARELGDPAALAQSLDDASFVRWSPADPEGWIALNVEISRAAQDAGDLELALQGEKGRVTGLLELGDFSAVEHAIETCAHIVDKLRTPYARWLLSSLHGMRALLAGRFEDAEARIVESLPLGERAQSPEVTLELHSQLLYLRLEQGRAAEVEVPARAQVERFPRVPAWRAALGRILVAEGRLLEARHELEHLSEEGFSDVPRDRAWLPTLALAAEIASATGAMGRSGQLQKLLAPFARLCVVAGSGLLFYGAVSHHLGLLAASQNQWDAAIQQLDAAEQVHERAGAEPWSARTRVALARALLGRGRLPDRRRASEKVAAALASARALGLTQIASEAQELDRRLQARPAVARGSHPRG